MTTAGYVALLGAGIGLALAARRRRRVLVAGLAASVLLLAVRALLGRAHALEARVVPWEVYPFVEWISPAPCVGFVAAVAALLGRRRAFRIAVLSVVGWAAILLGFVAIQIDLTDTSALHGVVNAHGYCAQTSEWSCGAAAAAMWLHSRGVEATEEEMARLCATNRFFGTSPVGLLRGLHRKVPGARLVVETPSRPPARAEGALLVAVRLTEWIDHWVVVDSIDESGATVRGPTPGGVRWDRAMLDSRWVGLVVREERE